MTDTLVERLSKFVKHTTSCAYDITFGHGSCTCGLTETMADLETQASREMTNPTTPLLKLAERCEAAAGPDLSINDDIARTINALEGRMWSGLSRPYTASLDAAMTLVDPRALWAIGSMEEGPFSRLCWPQPDGGFTGGYVEGQAESVPLSICAAALRARAAISSLTTESGSNPQSSSSE